MTQWIGFIYSLFVRQRGHSNYTKISSYNKHFPFWRGRRGQGVCCNINSPLEIRAKNRSKNKLVRKNAVTGAHGSYSLQVMGSWPMAQVEKLVVEEPQISRPKSLWKEGSILNYSDVCEHSGSTPYRMAFASTRKAIRYVMNSNGPGVKRAAFTQVEHCAGAVGWEGLVH